MSQCYCDWCDSVINLATEIPKTHPKLIGGKFCSYDCIQAELADTAELIDIYKDIEE